MDYILYIGLGALIIGVALYLIRQRVKRIDSDNPPVIVDYTPDDDDIFDRFICFMRSDGSTFPAFSSKEESDD